APGLAECGGTERTLLGRANAYAPVLSLEPRTRHAHHAENARAFARAMPIRSSARHQRKMLDERAEARDVFGRVTRMPDFDAVDAVAHEGFDTLARSALRRMRQHGDAARS